MHPLCHVLLLCDPGARGALHQHRASGAEAAAELKANGVEIQEYDDVLKFLAAETEPQTVLADPASVNLPFTRPCRTTPP